MSREIPPPSPAELREFCAFLYQRSGMAYGESKRYYIERRLAERMQRNDLPGFASYMALLRSSEAEAVAVVNSFTVNETYFYREEHQLRCLSRELLPAIVAGRGAGERVRIWSLPCATGEEAYSIALWLLEHWAMVDAYNIEIMGSDIDTRALAVAVQGHYGPRALARLPAEVVALYFDPPDADGQRRIIEDLRQSVQFTAANLMDTGGMAGFGRFDVIFCRNVLIYFDEAARLTAARHLYAALAPGGFLCLGHTESMSRILDSLVPRRFEDAVVYQRPPA